MKPWPAVFVRGYTAAQNCETSVPAIGISASISISAPSSVCQHASTLFSSTVSRWEALQSYLPHLRLLCSVKWGKYIVLFGYGSGVLREDYCGSEGASSRRVVPSLAVGTSRDLSL